MGPATSLAEVSRTLSGEPLRTAEELAAFYRPELNPLRGEDLVAQMSVHLEDAYSTRVPYHAFLMGHPGVGKSTELTRLAEGVKRQFRVIRFSVLTDLDPGSFQPFDVLLMLIAEVVERTARPVSEGGAGHVIPEAQLQEVFDFFAGEEISRRVTTQMEASGNAGAGPDATSLWAKVLGLFGALRGEMKFSSAREKKVVEYRLQRVNELLGTANRVLTACNAALRGATGQEWLFLAEDFDKQRIAPGLLERLFLTYGRLFQELQAHYVFSIPVALVYSSKGNQLPLGADGILNIPDTPVFQRNHQPHQLGREALRRIIEARVRLELFEQGQVERLIVASGGNLRDLFSMITRAAISARVRGGEVIGASDVQGAITQLRVSYQRRLGVSQFDDDEVSYEAKAERLVQVYHSEPRAEVPDAVLHSLLLARAVQEFNGDRWFGVHPLVVDWLQREGSLKAEGPGEKVLGGTE